MSQARRMPWRSVGLGWIAANTVGYAVAFAVWVRWSQPIWPPLSQFLGGSLTLALYGATLGVGVSVAQAFVLKGRLVRPLVWILATTLAFTVSFMVASWVGLMVMRAFPPGSDKYLSNSTINIAFGLLVGGGIGVARWFVLRGTASAAAGWMLVSAVCFMVGYGAAVGIFQLIPPVEQTTLGALFGACIGAITSSLEWLWFGRRPLAWAESATLSVA